MRDIRALLEPVHSLDQTISIVEKEIAAQDIEVDSLERWVKRLNFKRYRPMRGWPVELRNAHAKYKALGMAIRRPRVKFENAEREYLETRDRTPEDSLDGHILPSSTERLHSSIFDPTNRLWAKQWVLTHNFRTEPLRPVSTSWSVGTEHFPMRRQW
jgi:hypothetical protein